MEKYQDNFFIKEIDTFSSKTNDETKLFINMKDKSDYIDKKFEDYSNNINEIKDKNKKISIPNLNLNGFLDKRDYSNFQGNEVNLNDFLCRKRENDQISYMDINSIENSSNLNRHNFLDNKDENYNEIVVSNKEKFENSNNFEFKIIKNNNNTSIRKIGAKIIKASPTDSPVLNKKMEFLEENKIKVESNKSLDSHITNESKITEDLEAQVNDDPKNQEKILNSNQNDNNQADQIFVNLIKNEPNEVSLDLNEIGQGN